MTFPQGGVVGTVQASNSPTSFAIVPGSDPAGNFTINSATGQITAAQAINGTGTETISVTATNAGGTSAPASITVNWSPVVAGATVTADVMIPGGGWIYDMDAHADGTMIAGADIGAIYIGSNVPGSVWQWGATGASMPAAYTSTPFYIGGFYGGRIAPSNSSVIYGALLGNQFSGSNGTLIFTTNKGVSWTQATSFPGFSGNIAGSGNDGKSNARIAIHPTNPNIVFAGGIGTALFACTDGSTFSQVGGGIGTASGVGYTGMYFDPNTPNRLVAGVTGTGIQISANANLGASSTWTTVSGSPTNPGRGKMASDSNYYCNDASQSATLHRVTPGGVHSTIATGMSGVANFDVDPFNPARIAATVFGQLSVGGPINGAPSFSGQNSNFSAGASAAQSWFHNSSVGYNAPIGLNGAPGELFFDRFNTTSTTPNTIGTGTFTFTVGAGLNIAAGDVIRVTNTGVLTNYMLGTVSSYSGTSLVMATLATAPGGYTSTTVTGGSGTFSAWTITKERLWYSTGAGVFYSDGLRTGSQANTWVPSCAGIESLVTKDVIWPTNGVPLGCAADFGTYQFNQQPFQNPQIGVSGNSFLGSGLIEGSAIDWASSNPSFVCLSHTANAGFSTTGGANGAWTAFSAAVPSRGGANCIAADSASNILAANSAGIFFTTNGGASWSAVGGVPTGGWIGSSPDVTGMTPKNLCASRQEAGTFYAYNTSNTTLYKIVLPGGAVTTLRTTALSTNSDGPFGKIETIPASAGTVSTVGHIFYSCGMPTFAPGAFNAGFNPSPATYPLMFSANSGVTWTGVPNVAFCLFGITKAMPAGNGYPAIVVYGWVNGVFGIYRCDNFNTALSGLTWTNLGVKFPRGWLNYSVCMRGDPNQWGRFIIGCQGGGWGAFQITGQPNTWP